MIPFDEAVSILNSSAKVLGSEHVSLLGASGRILAADVVAQRDVPAHDLSAMDGFACRREDTAGPLVRIETIPAGRRPKRSVGRGQCARIMTGALVPEGANMVVRFEDAREQDSVVTVAPGISGTNIRSRAEDLRKGDPVVGAGVIITPAVLAVLASEGCDPVPVYRQPVVGIIATGDELVEPSSTPDDTQIRNSNSHQIHAQTAATGCIPVYYGIARDTPHAVETLVDRAIEQCDVIVLSGGVSAGDFDHVPGVLTSRRFGTVFNGIAVKPGKPTLFARSHDRFVFGIPGNPTASLVIFEMLVKPFLYRMMGHEFSHRSVLAKLGESIKRRNSDRLEFLPVVFAQDRTVRAVPYHGSAHLSAYAKAQGMVAVPQGASCMPKESVVEVVLI